MNWKEFVEKWVNKNESLKTPGKVDLFRDTDYNLQEYQDYQVDAYVVVTPNKKGWKNDNQKKIFEKDAKLVGLTRKKGRLLEWYRIIQLHDLD